MAEPAEPAGISMTTSATPESVVFVGKSGAAEGPNRVSKKAATTRINKEEMTSCFFIVVFRFRWQTPISQLPQPYRWHLLIPLRFGQHLSNYALH